MTRVACCHFIHEGCVGPVVWEIESPLGGLWNRKFSNIGPHRPYGSSGMGRRTVLLAMSSLMSVSPEIFVSVAPSVVPAHISFCLSWAPKCRFNTFFPKTSQLGRVWPQPIPLHAPLVKTSSNDAHHDVQNSATTPWGAGCLAIPKGSIAANAPIECNINFNEDHPYPVVEFLASLIGGGTTCILYGRSLGHDRARAAWRHERHIVHHVAISVDGYGVNIWSRIY